MITQVPVFHATFQLVFTIIALLLLIFDAILLMATLSNRNDPNIPFSYIVVMSISGIMCKIAFITDFVTYLILPYNIYYWDYRIYFGKEFTMLGTLTYFIPMCVSVLMTSNRLFIVMKPTNQHVFGRQRIFLYSFGVLVICFTLLFIPYLSTCPVNFLASTLVFVTACAPERHPVTRFTNINAIWVPTAVLVINTVVVMYLKGSRILQKTAIRSMKSSLVVGQKRKESMLARQTVAISIYLSFYEVGSLLMRTFPETYGSLPSYVKDSYFYFRLETICAICFFVYFMENSLTRKMVKKYMGIGEKSKKKWSGATISGPHKISTISHSHLLF